MTKIMLVEDDKSLREIYSIRLAAEGYDIVSAGDGEEGLAMAVREKPDLIIADVMMPKISGFDMLDILRSQPETSQIKAIVMTALSSEDQRQRGESLGAAKYLVKSQVGIEDVIDAVHEVLGDTPNSNAHTNIGMAKAVSDAERKTAPSAAPNPAPTAPAATPAPSAPTAPGPVTAAAPTGTIGNADELVQDANHLQKQGIAPDTEQVLQQANIQESVRQMYEQLRQQQLQKQQHAAANTAAPAAPTPQAVAAAAPPTPKATTATNAAGMTSRVIAPIHDTSADARDTEMQAKMAAILGDDSGAKPAAVTSGGIATPEQEAQAVEKTDPIPPPPAPPASTPTAPNTMPLPPSAADAPKPAPTPAPTSTPAPAPSPAPAQTPAPAPTPADNPAPAEKGANIPEEINADTPIPSIDEIDDPGIAETIKPAQPGYLSNLTEELSEDMQDGTAPEPNSMAAQMSAELADDALTGAAQAKAKSK